MNISYRNEDGRNFLVIKPPEPESSDFVTDCAALLSVLATKYTFFKLGAVSAIVPPRVTERLAESLADVCVIPLAVKPLHPFTVVTPDVAL